ncbi:hypothetical protein CLV95_102214 [Leptospira borgpetersenii serovar Javanica]|nr:hypothetical protein CLV95_102214 [Leptospira borgpetersenii serovar Javanica]
MLRQLFCTFLRKRTEKNFFFALNHQESCENKSQYSLKNAAHIERIETEPSLASFFRTHSRDRTSEFSRSPTKTGLRFKSRPSKDSRRFPKRPFVSLLRKRIQQTEYRNRNEPNFPKFQHGWFASGHQKIHENHCRIQTKFGINFQKPTYSQTSDAPMCAQRISISDNAP